jgi:hypothetical protein
MAKDSRVFSAVISAESRLFSASGCRRKPSVQMNGGLFSAFCVKRSQGDEVSGGNGVSQYSYVALFFRRRHFKIIFFVHSP